MPLAQRNELVVVRVNKPGRRRPLVEMLRSPARNILALVSSASIPAKKLRFMVPIFVHQVAGRRFLSAWHQRDFGVPISLEADRKWRKTSPLAMNSIEPPWLVETCQGNRSSWSLA